MKDLTALKERCEAAVQDPKILLAALLLQLGERAIIDHKYLIQATCEFTGQCFIENTPAGIVLSMKETCFHPNLKKSPLEDDDFLNKILETGDAADC